MLQKSLGCNNFMQFFSGYCSTGGCVLKSSEMVIEINHISVWRRNKIFHNINEHSLTADFDDAVVSL